MEDETQKQNALTPAPQPSRLPPPPVKKTPWLDARGRFAKGNPGKPRGTKNKLTKLAASLFEDSAQEIGEAVIAAARKGDMIAARLVLERVLPPKRARTISLPGFPRIRDVSDVPKAIAYLSAQVVKGKITADEADAIAGILEKYVSAVSATEYGERLAALEAAQDGTRSTTRAEPFTFKLDKANDETVGLDPPSED